MNIDIKVITNAKKREITAVGSELKVKLTSLPIDGRANEELIEYLSAFFQVRKSDVKRKKVIALPVDDATLRAFLHERVKVTTG
jgi:uncharacterized protein YggU (UPF0235/DUF167 family)